MVDWNSERKLNILLHTSLVTVTHDPEGKNIEFFERLQLSLEEIYEELFITISEESSLELIKAIENSRFNFKIIPKTGAANARREALRYALTGKGRHFHYCDFDRILTWGKNHLNELKVLVGDIPNHDYLILGRTERAMKTHPIEWIETEKITNHIVSLELGKEVDITAGSCGFSRESAEYITTYSKEKMTDAEWAIIVHRIVKRQVDYRAVEGLEFEEEINGLNRIISDSDKWFSRLRLGYIISETAMKVGK